jgi:hypothetical protein
VAGVGDPHLLAVQNPRVALLLYGLAIETRLTKITTHTHTQKKKKTKQKKTKKIS